MTHAEKMKCFLGLDCIIVLIRTNCLFKMQLHFCFLRVIIPGPEVIKLFSCSTQLRLKFILLINVKMQTIVGILTFIGSINDWLYKQDKWL